MATHTHITPCLPPETLIDIRDCLALVAVSSSLLARSGDDPAEAVALVQNLRSVLGLANDLAKAVCDEVERTSRAAAKAVS